MTINMNSEDLNRTYGDTYIGVRQDTEILAGHVIGSSERNRIDVRVYKGSKHTTLPYDINDPTLVLAYPDSGAFNVGKNSAAFVSRQAQRQWRRGITQRHLIITGDVAFDSKLVYGMFNPRYTDAQTAVAQALENKTYSAALDRNFWVRRMPMYVNPLIMFRNTCVGEYIESEAKIEDDVISRLYKEVVR